MPEKGKKNKPSKRRREKKRREKKQNALPVHGDQVRVEEWACTHCTNLNCPNLSKCSICKTVKGAPPPPSSPMTVYSPSWDDEVLENLVLRGIRLEDCWPDGWWEK